MKIDNDPNQYLMVLESNEQIIGTCHLTIMPSLTFLGSIRLQIEAVRISERFRGQKFGEWMISEAIAYEKSQGGSIVQLSMDKTRLSVRSFYEKLGFKVTYEGMKLYFQEIQ